MSNDWWFAMPIIAFNEVHIVRFVLIVIDYVKPNMYLTIQIIPQPNHRLLDDLFPTTICRMNAQIQDLVICWNDQFVISPPPEGSSFATINNSDLFCQSVHIGYKSHKAALLILYRSYIFQVKCENIYNRSWYIRIRCTPSSVCFNFTLLS